MPQGAHTAPRTASPTRARAGRGEGSAQEPHAPGGPHRPQDRDPHEGRDEDDDDRLDEREVLGPEAREEEAEDEPADEDDDRHDDAGPAARPHGPPGHVRFWG